MRDVEGINAMHAQHHMLSLYMLSVPYSYKKNKLEVTQTTELTKSSPENPKLTKSISENVTN